MVRQVLQRAFDLASHGFQELCPTCLGPSRLGSGVLLLREEEPVPGCPACGETVDREGRTVSFVQEGQPQLMVIRLRSGPAHQVQEE